MPRVIGPSKTRSQAPVRPPSEASTKLSVSICRTNRPRLPPSARRSAISLRREAAARQQQVRNIGAGRSGAPRRLRPLESPAWPHVLFQN